MHMEPVSTSLMVGAVVGYLAQQLKNNQSVHDFLNEFTQAAVAWIRPLFLTDDEKPKEIIQDLQSDPEEPLNTAAVENALHKALKKDPSAEAMLRAMYEVIQAKAAAGQPIAIVGSKNTVTGTINAGGDVIVGDNNTR